MEVPLPLDYPFRVSIDATRSRLMVRIKHQVRAEICEVCFEQNHCPEANLDSCRTFILVRHLLEKMITLN
jgi:hypothetical protein